MAERNIHIVKEVKFESARGGLTFSNDSKGFTIEMFEVPDGEHRGANIKSEGLPLDFARTIRDFLNYALEGAPVEVMVDDGAERRLGERRTMEIEP